LITRAILVAVPFVIWFVWRAWARRTGREMGATPWAWLSAAAALLVGLSLMATAVFHKDNRGERYVPAEVLPDGKVTGSRFEPAKK
jgi:hypothetical protein